MHSAHCHIDGMLDDSVVTLDSYEVAFDVVVNLYIIKSCVVLSVDISDLVKLFLE